MKSELSEHPASYRDPAGFIFTKDNIYYRQVNQGYKDNYDLFMKSGLYHKLVSKGLMVSHAEVDSVIFSENNWYKTLLPEQIPFISYAYEWCFSQLRSAALLTLSLQKIALKYGMALKDATHFNVQYIGSSPIFIDTLSFDKYEPSLPWVAYMQFCECFLYPLFIEHYTGMPVHKTLLAYPDGIPLSIVNSLLPFRSRFSFGVGLHVILPSKISRRQSGTKIPVKFNEQKMLRLLNNLHSIIFSLRPAQKKGVWGDYYERTVLKEGYLAEKERIFDEMLNKITFKKVLDIGANDGYFSKIIAKRAEQIIAIDSEYFCIDKLFRELKTDNKNILPLCIDFANPSPDTGFSGNERISFLRRGNYDLVIALAVMHHLVVAENIPLPLLARSLHTLTKHLIIEFVPLDDEKVDLIAANKQEIAAQLVKENFEDIFTRYFSIIDSVTVGYTKRIIYLMIVK